MLNLHAPNLQRPILEALYWVFILVCLAFGWFGWVFGWWIFVGLAMIGLGILFYGGFVEPRLVRVMRYRLGDSTEEQSLRLVFVSDLHAGLKKGPGFYTKIAERIQALKPNLLVLGGDLVDERASDAAALQAIVELKLPLGVWFVLGNHDFFDDPNVVTSWMKSYGARELTNETLNFKLHEEQTLEIIGLDDSWYGTPALELLKPAKKDLRIIVTHEPDLLLDIPEKNADLILLGHTHGGQISLPGYGPLTGLPQAVPQWLDAGEKRWRDMRVIISRGLAEAGVRARLGSRPEIVVVDIYPTLKKE